MQEGSVVKQIARWVAIIALFGITIAPVIVFNGLYFPFITGKAFYVRILIEVAVAAWAVLALMDKAYRPRFSLIGAAVVAFVAWMFIADLFAINVAKAFWSNFERMEGWVLLIHLLGFFFAASAVLRAEKKWRGWFLASLAVAVIVSIHGILQQFGVLPVHQGATRIDSSFGNSAYFAIYLLFNAFLSWWLALTEKRQWLKWVLFAFGLLEAALIFFTETRGTVLGLLGGLGLTALLFAITAGKKTRRYAIGGLVVLVLAAGSLYAARHTPFVHTNPVLDRITSISLKDGQVRFTIWHMAWEGFLERPITGWGQEGFNYVFNKFYDPSLYTQEPWFDRAHNAFIDWLSAGGILGFITYLSLFASLIWLLWRRSELSRPERILLTAAIAGYACHNFFVFDNLYSYIYFFAILSFVDSRVSRPMRWFENAPEISPADAATIALPISAVLCVLAIWFVNVTGIRASTELITAISSHPGGPSVNIATFEDLVKHPAFAAQEVREQLVTFASSLMSQVSQDPNATDQQKKEAEQAIQLAITQMGEQVAQYPMDARERLQLAYAYRAEGDLKDTIAQLKEAQKYSPGKESIYVQEGITQWDAGNPQAAQAAFAKAYQLGPQFPKLATYAAAGDFAVGDAQSADVILQKNFGTTTVDSDVLAVAYYRSKDWPRLIALWKMRADKPGATVQDQFGLAAAYYAAGKNATAIALLREIEKKYPSASSSVESAIKQIQAGVPVH